MRRRAAGLALAALLLAGAPALAAVRVRTDHADFVRFRLAARFLTVRPLIVDRALWGERVRAVCTARRSPAAQGVRTWPRGARALTLRLSRDVSRHVRACRLESAPARVTIARVRFAAGQGGR